MKVYISGKVSGLDYELVQAKFAKAEAFLNEIDGFEAVNPLCNGLPPEAPWSEHMARDIEMLHDCHCIYMLDDWQQSTGARIEYEIAVSEGKIILFASQIVRHREIVQSIERAVHEATGLRLGQYSTKSRKRDHFFARMLFVHHCRQHEIKLVEIARMVRRDHSSVSHFLRTYESEVRFNPRFRALAERVSSILDKTMKQ